jgi:CheY-like chemotaxis protein
VSAVSPPAAFVLQVLVVEDEVNLAHVFRDCVIALGHQAEVVGSAEAALERLQVAPPHVIILDVNLPGMSGMDFLGLPVVRDSGIPIIVVSGFVTEEQARECLRLGALEFLAKPVPLEVLGTVLDHVAVFAHPPDAGPQERRRAGRLPVTLPLRVTAELGGVATGAPGWIAPWSRGRRRGCRSGCRMAGRRWMRWRWSSAPTPTARSHSGSST